MYTRYCTIINDYYVMSFQIDNGNDFVDMGGMELINRELNHTYPEIQSEAAFVLGSVAQRLKKTII